MLEAEVVLDVVFTHRDCRPIRDLREIPFSGEAFAADANTRAAITASDHQKAFADPLFDEQHHPVPKVSDSSDGPMVSTRRIVARTTCRGRERQFAETAAVRFGRAVRASMWESHCGVGRRRLPPAAAVHTACRLAARDEPDVWTSVLNGCGGDPVLLPLTHVYISSLGPLNL